MKQGAAELRKLMASNTCTTCSGRQRSRSSRKITSLCGRKALVTSRRFFSNSWRTSLFPWRLGKTNKSRKSFHTDFAEDSSSLCGSALNARSWFTRIANPMEMTKNNESPGEIGDCDLFASSHGLSLLDRKPAIEE